MKNLYLVKEGTVTKIDAPVEFDGNNSVLAVAESFADALKLAEDYDNGLIQYDNIEWKGSTIAALFPSSYKAFGENDLTPGLPVFMHTFTGSVANWDDWRCEIDKEEAEKKGIDLNDEEAVTAYMYESLTEVVRDDNGNWVEA